MASQPGRTPSIPIPRNPSSSSNRNIESVISIPSISPSRPRLSSTQGHPSRSGGADGSRSASIGHRLTPGLGSLSVSPNMMLSRPVTFSTSHPTRYPSHFGATFEPRVVQAVPDISRNGDNSCTTSQSPTQLRRASGIGNRSTSVQRRAPSLPPLPNVTPTSFPRPAYLDHSALRHMIATETPSSAPPAPSRKVENAGTRSHSVHTYAMTPSSDSDDDISPSPPPMRDVRGAPPVVSQEQVTFALPTRWGDQDRSPILNISHDGRELSLHSSNNHSDKEAAASARANQPVPPACGIYYYEVEVQCKEQKSHISIGFVSRVCKYSRLPGWEPQSWGYHGDDGHVYDCGRPGAAYSQPYGAGDIIGCGIDFTNHKVFYTKNQAFLGYVFDEVGKDVEIYPAVGLRHSGDVARVNFGHEPFRFDIEDHVQQRRNTTWSNIMKTPLDATLLRGRYHKNAIKNLISIVEPPPLTDDESKTVLNQLVLSYLVHHGYAKTARAFQKQQRGENKPRISQEGDVEMDEAHNKESYDDFEEDIELRTGIVNAVIRGDIDTALEDTQRFYPKVLEAEDGLMLFKLRCRKLVELILETNEIKRRMNSGKEREEFPLDVVEPNGRHNMDDDGMNMDVDDDAISFGTPIKPPPINLALPDGHGKLKSRSPGPEESKFRTMPPTVADFEAALTRAISYGQNFNNDYKAEKRPELRQMFEQASSVIAWNNPFEAGGDAAEVAGHEARIGLANELNEAILKSQGRPTRPTLETIYRQTAACIVQLGITGVGSAVYADLPRELLEA